MNRAMWKGKILLAEEVAKDYEYEKQIRLASRAGDLLCVDLDCKNNILRYCHGEKRGAYFAHRSSDYSCSYGEFDKENTDVIRNLTHKLKSVFEKQGFHVEIDKKVFDRHYAHLVIKNNMLHTAIEIVDARLTVKKVNYLIKSYESVMNVAWLVIDDVENQISEDGTYYAKRFLLNEGNGKNLVVVDNDCNRVKQYRCDFNDYFLEENRRYFPEKDLFAYEGIFEQLTINGFGITLGNYKTEYNAWISNRSIAFENAKKRYHQTKIKKRKQEEKRKEELKREQEKRRQEDIENESKLKEEKDLKLELEEKLDTEDQIKIQELLQQQETQARDRKGNRWIRCKHCGKDGKEGEFKSFGGLGEVNLGYCNNCYYVVKKQEPVKTDQEKPKKDWSNICPVCGGKLVERSSAYGRFWGCSNYPKCKFTKKISNK